MYGDHPEGYWLGGGRGRLGENGAGIKKHNWKVQNRQVVVKNSIGNGEAKELTCTTHGHELRGVAGLLEGRKLPGGEGQRGKNWDNCNSIISKIYLQKKKMKFQTCMRAERSIINRIRRIKRQYWFLRRK